MGLLTQTHKDRKSRQTRRDFLFDLFLHMELSINTPALLFPAISLLMLAYTNRFLSLANLIRNLHDKYKKDKDQKHIIDQIRNLRARVRLIRSMQAFGVLSFLFCVVCMFCIFKGWATASYLIFAASIGSFIVSLILSLIEITLSMRALEVELSDMEELTRSSFFGEILGGAQKNAENAE